MPSCWWVFSRWLSVDFLIYFCLMAELQKSNSTSLLFFQVSESGLKPNQAIALLAVEGVTVRSDELSRALTPLVLEFVKRILRRSRIHWHGFREGPSRSGREESVGMEYVQAAGRQALSNRSEARSQNHLPRSMVYKLVSDEIICLYFLHLPPILIIALKMISF
jgi:hypothetical protein